MSHSHSSLSEHDLPHHVAPFPVHLHIPHLPLQSCGVNTHLIHGQQDGFVVWPYEVRSQVMSPSPWLRSSGQRLLLLTDHQRGHVSAQWTIPRTPQLHLCLRKFCERQSAGRLASPLLISPVWFPPVIFFSTDRTPPMCVLFSPETATKRSLPSGNCYNAGTYLTS